MRCDAMGRTYAMLPLPDGSCQVWELCQADVGQGCPLDLHCECLRTEAGAFRSFVSTWPGVAEACEAVFILQEASEKSEASIGPPARRQAGLQLSLLDASGVAPQGADSSA